MSQYITGLSTWFVTENYRAKAKLKYEIKRIETRLDSLYTSTPDIEWNQELGKLSTHLAEHYIDYLKLSHSEGHTIKLDAIPYTSQQSYKEHYYQFKELRTKWSQALELSDEVNLLKDIIFELHNLSNPEHIGTQADSRIESKKLLESIKQKNLSLWLSAMIDLWNGSNQSVLDFSDLQWEWSYEDHRNVLQYFANPDLVDLVNAVFFYKLYPDKLFDEIIHPEKLVSIRIRVGLLHECIEQLQEQLYTNAHQLELSPGVDKLFHGDELPQGILIDVLPHHKELVQNAIKKLKVSSTHEDNEKINIERLFDLGRAYKFWFNPNRLIDAVMVLFQRLVQNEDLAEANFFRFQNEMVLLFAKFNTTQCMDLYGYFANNDSRYLMYTLSILVQGKNLEWLPNLNPDESNAIRKVYFALTAVMEALRAELKNRHISTEAYHVEQEDKSAQIGRRNREAVLRVVAVYGCSTITLSDSLEKMFCLMEEQKQTT